jgi:hypothetical protein
VKKITLISITILLIVLTHACSSSKEARTNKKIIDGNWLLQSINVEAVSGKVKAIILDETDLICFENSIWKFNQNTSLGSYEITKNGGDCVAKKQNIRWSILEEKGMPLRLQFKKVDAKNYKALDDGSTGYRFTITYLDNIKMQLKSEIILDGKTINFIYNFTKN